MAEQARTTSNTQERAQLNRRISGLIDKTWYVQRVMLVHQTPTSRSYIRTRSMRYRHWVFNYWRHVNGKAWVKFRNVPHKSSWLCIHGYEGSWKSNTGNGYHGGLQMDESFQSHFGSYLLKLKGMAENWTPLEQMWIAERAYSESGFSRWPNTARACGLL